MGPITRLIAVIGDKFNQGVDMYPVMTGIYRSGIDIFTTRTGEKDTTGMIRIKDITKKGTVPVVRGMATSIEPHWKWQTSWALSERDVREINPDV